MMEEKTARQFFKLEDKCKYDTLMAASQTNDEKKKSTPTIPQNTNVSKFAHNTDEEIKQTPMYSTVNMGPQPYHPMYSCMGMPPMASPAQFGYGYPYWFWQPNQVF